MNREANRKATVAQFVENLDIGGLESMVLALSKRLHAGRWRSVIFCLGEGGALVERAAGCGIDVTVFRKKEGLDAALPLRLSNALRREKVDVLQCHNYGPLVYGSVAARTAGIKGIVYTVHGRKTSREKKQNWLFRLGRIRHVVAVSENVRRLVLQAGGVPAQRVTTIPNGIDIEAYDRVIDRKAKRTEIGVNDSARLLGIVARLSPEKDHETLFEAFSRLRGEFDDVHLVVVGGGKLLEELERSARRLAIESRVHFLGSRSDVAELLGVFDCFVLSSRSEGLSLTLLEAMAAGLPVVATDVGGNGEVVRHGETGLLVPAADPGRMADALRRIFADEAEARRMGERGLARVREHFSLDKMVAGYERIYDEILGEA